MICGCESVDLADEIAGREKSNNLDSPQNGIAATEHVTARVVADPAAAAVSSNAGFEPLHIH